LLNLTYYDKNLLEYAHTIILSHVLEHIHPQLAIRALKNCFAYLKPGGYIRVSVPYLEAYNQANLPQCQDVCNRMLAKNRLIYGWGHQFMYDADLLGVLLEEAGFVEVKEETFGKGLLGETDSLEHRAESIYLTAIKS
jgi:predicted SAM-dependent methyltransferase